MVRIFHDDKSGEFLVQTTCLTADEFVTELSEALHGAIGKAAADDGGLTAMGILKNAMPIAFKLSGYKAEAVYEQRTLVCGIASPEKCGIVSSAGR